MSNAKLRFTENDGKAYPDWKTYKLGELYTERNERGNDSLPILTISIHSGVSSGEMDEDELGKRVARSEDKSLYKRVCSGDLAFNMMRAWQGAIGVVRSEGMISPAYIAAKPSNSIYPPFMDYCMRTDKMIHIIDRQSYGLTDFRKRLYWDSFISIDCSIPESVEEQKKIAEFLDKIEERISLQESIVGELEKRKTEILRQVFTQELRFKKEDGSQYPEWEYMTVRECLDYEQPGKYIVSSEEYSDDYSTPVLTANKGFILGYTNEIEGIYNKGNVIIYDDFTMDMKYVTFPFKVKSSAMKMLTIKPTVMDKTDLYFMYCCLKAQNLSQVEHSRSYISKVEPLEIGIPSFEEQRRIVDFMSRLDDHIENERAILNDWIQMKKGLLQQMFI